MIDRTGPPRAEAGIKGRRGRCARGPGRVAGPGRERSGCASRESRTRQVRDEAGRKPRTRTRALRSLPASGCAGKHGTTIGEAVPAPSRPVWPWTASSGSLPCPRSNGAEVGEWGGRAFERRPAVRVREIACPGGHVRGGSSAGQRARRISAGRRGRGQSYVPEDISHGGAPGLASGLGEARGAFGRTRATAGRWSGAGAGITCPGGHVPR